MIFEDRPWKACRTNICCAQKAWKATRGRQYWRAETSIVPVRPHEKRTTFLEVSLRSPPPFRLKPTPPTILRLRHQSTVVHDHIVRSISRDVSPTNIATHSNIEQNLIVPHWSRPGRDAGLHDRSPIDTPQEPPLTGLSTRLIPREIKADGSTVHIVYIRLYHSMFLVVFAVEVAPVEA